MQLEPKAVAALLCFIIQNGTGALILRYATSRSAPYSTQVAVLMSEMAVKLPISLVLYVIECGGLVKMCTSICTDVRTKPMEWLKLSIPAILFTMSNNMVYIGYANLSAAFGLVLYQTKVPLTAFFSVWLLNKRLTANQWIAVFVLVGGVVLARLSESTQSTHTAAPPASGHMPNSTRMLLANDEVHEWLGSAATDWPGSAGELTAEMLARLASDGATALHGLRRQLEEAAVGAEEPRAQNVLVGIIAFIIATSCSSFAGVYVELMLTGGDKPSLWLRNIQLAVYSSIAATIGLVATAPSNPMVREGGLFYGFGFWAWLCIAWQAAGGIIVAVVIKHAGNILRCFASGLAIIVGAAGSWAFFDYEIKLPFVVGVAFVVAASVMYTHPAKTPAELYAKLNERHA